MHDTVFNVAGTHKMIFDPCTVAFSFWEDVSTSDRLLG